MSKIVFWMQGFDHLPSFTETTQEVFSSFISRMALIPNYKLGGTSSSKIGGAVVNGVDYYGINMGISSVNFNMEAEFLRSEYSSARIWAGLRISASDSVLGGGSSGAGIVAELRASNNSSPYPYCYAECPGGAFSMYIEVAIDYYLNQAFFFVDGQQVAIGSISADETKVRFSMSDNISSQNYGSVPGVGFVYSDFYLASEPNGADAPEPVPFGGLRVKSGEVYEFGGDSGYYNTLNNGIVEDLNSFYGANYQPVGGYLHVPDSLGTISFEPFDSADGVIALQVSSLITPPPVGKGLNQEMYFGNTKLSTVVNEYVTPAGAFRPHITVYNPTEEISSDSLNSLNVRIEAI